MLLMKETELSKKEILDWISGVIEEPINSNETFEEVLEDGSILRKYG